MKKILLILFISFGFIGPVYAAKNAGLALTYGFGSVAIAAVLGFVLFILIKPKKDSEEKKAVYYGRLLLAYSLWASTTAVFPRFLIWPDINTFLLWLVPSIFFGFIAYIIGSAYGASKKTAVKLAKKTKTITKTAIEKSVKKPIKKTVEKPQELATKKNITKNENTMDEEKIDEINDEEFYLIATKEVEGGDIHPGLWAKCMAINTGDEVKAKYCYINKRVAILTNDAKEEALLKVADEEIQRLDEKEEEIAHKNEEKLQSNNNELLQKIKSEIGGAQLDPKLWADALANNASEGYDAAVSEYIEKRTAKINEEDVTEEKRISEEAENYSIDGIKFNSKEDYEAYIDLQRNDKE